MSKAKISAPRVLIVDDNVDNREYAREVLCTRWRCQEASDGCSALEAIRACRPDLVLLDLSMPGLSGWEVLERLKADEATREIPVVACTAHAMAGDRERALSAGFADYLAKPYRPADLRSLVERFVGVPEAPTTTPEAEDDGWGGADWSLAEDDWE
ncbi:MAG: response regulator [Planctomycetota bacterium]|nr:MAG: response regulator [Planctomycetota bacterium]